MAVTMAHHQVIANFLVCMGLEAAGLSPTIWTLRGLSLSVLLFPRPVASSV